MAGFLGRPAEEPRGPQRNGLGMKTLFVIIGVVVIFGILIRAGGIAGGLCVQGVGCVRSTDGGGVTLDGNDGPVTIGTSGRP